MKFFNTAGPVNCDDHYCLPPLGRFNLDEISNLIDQKKYFVLHAPRQTGKTSCLLALMKHLNEGDKFKALYINVESAQAARENIEEGVRYILYEIDSRCRFHLDNSFLNDIRQDLLAKSGASAFSEAVTLLCGQNDLPTVLFIDEIDALVGDMLISILRQLRAGYDKRPAHFLQSVILCGVRDVRDYRIHSSREKAVITGGSAFNIKAKSLRLEDFIKDEVQILLNRHTEETGQKFDPEAIDLIWDFAEGQPWLTNALAYETCFEMKENRDRSVAITAEMVHQAKENIILRREIHIDQLADKLAEARVQRVIEPILAGLETPEFVKPDDLAYVRDLGLIKTEGNIRISNRIYQEVIPRELTYSTQLTIAKETQLYVRPDDGTLDMPKLLAEFQQFFREHSEIWEERFHYKEAGPQLLLQAFLQRIINAGGRVEREYGLGRMRTDLLVVWNRAPKVQKTVIELKLLHKSLNATITAGLAQTFAYMDRCGAQDGHLVIFDRDGNKTWDEKIFQRREDHQGKAICIWGM